MESLQVVWHDPTSYDPLRHAPPYLPTRQASEIPMKTQDKISAVYDTFPGTGSPLSSLLAVLQAASLLHKSHHWQTHGLTYYADHLLFDRLYTESQDFIDQVAERAVGTYSEVEVDPRQQSQRMANIIRLVDSGNEGPQDMVATSLRMEELVLRTIDEAKARLEATGKLSNGTDNLLQGAADLHETFVYLLKQRTKTASSGAYSYAR